MPPTFRPGLPSNLPPNAPAGLLAPPPFSSPGPAPLQPQPVGKPPAGPVPFSPTLTPSMPMAPRPFDPAQPMPRPQPVPQPGVPQMPGFGDPRQRVAQALMARGQSF